MKLEIRGMNRFQQIEVIASYEGIQAYNPADKPGHIAVVTFEGEVDVIYEVDPNMVGKALSEIARMYAKDFDRAPEQVAIYELTHVVVKNPLKPKELI